MITRPLPLLLGAALVLVAGGVSLASMGSSVLPTLEESQYWFAGTRRPEPRCPRWTVSRRGPPASCGGFRA